MSCKLIVVGSVILFSLCLTMSTPARAGEVEDLMARIDKATQPAADQVAVMKMTITDKSGASKVRQLAIKLKGTKLRLIKFMSPAEVKGVSFLARADDEMYIYMPEFGKVRRIASHTKSESFMGSDFSYDQVGSTEMGAKNNGTIVKREGDLTILELRPKVPADSELSRTLATVDTRYNIVIRGEDYDKSGKLYKVMTQEDIRQVNGYWLAHRITMRNEREGSSTVLEMSQVSFDTGLADDDFSQRNMKRGNCGARAVDKAVPRGRTSAS